MGLLMMIILNFVLLTSDYLTDIGCEYVQGILDTIFP